MLDRDSISIRCNSLGFCAMTEQEYCDLSDLQLCRAMLQMMRSVNSFEDPNKTRRDNIMENLGLMIDDLEPKVSKALDKDT